MSRWHSSCVSGKRPYRDQAEAREALDAVRRRRKGRAERSVYRCEYCGGWHLASTSNKPTRPASRLAARSETP